jgi:hypothetical protein
MQTTSATYRLLTTDLTRTLSQTSAEKSVALESAYYLKNIGNIKSIDDLLSDTRLFKYAMNAFGLSEMNNAKAFMRKVLTEGVSDSSSFANRLDDDRFVRFATTFNFAADGDQTTTSADAQRGVVDRYVRQTLETEAGQDNQGVQLALYFQREAPNVKSAYGLLGDSALWKVVQTVFGFPDAMANADIDAQAAAVNARLDVSDLKDPAKLAKLITRFTAAWDATQDTTQDPVLTLFSSDVNSSPVDLDLNLIMTLNTLKHGGT